jgi:hypothetical protein
LLIAVGLAALACAPAPTVTEKEEGTTLALPFVEDDYARALVEARSRRLPLFVEAWAPW